MAKSTVVDNDTGKSVDSTVRTSTGTFFGRGQDEIIAAVEKRVSLVSVNTPPPLSQSCLRIKNMAFDSKRDSNGVMFVG